MPVKFEPFEVERPWGFFRQFCENTPATVKILNINPASSLSLQSHAKREEFWHVISGNGQAIIGDTLEEINIGDEMVIPFNVKHRLIAGPVGLKIMEISYGDFSEDDFIRYEDKYGRI